MGLITYIKETRNELKHVSWPTRRQSIGYTVVVVGLAVVVAYFLGAFDLLFTYALEKLIL